MDRACLCLRRRRCIFCLGGEASECGIGKLAVHLDMGFTQEGEAVSGAGGAGITEELAEDVGEELGEEGGFLEGVRLAG